jgi:uncharacterized protein
MDITGEYRIPASRQKVWEALNNPEVLRAAIPGCESIEKLSDTEMTARVSARVGPVAAKFSGKVTLSDLDPPNGYRISGEGTGGAAGFAKGGATVKLADDGAGGTVLSYQAAAQVGGKLAQIGSRLIDGVARKMADDFFGRFSAAVAAPSPAAETEGAIPAAAARDKVAQPETIASASTKPETAPPQSLTPPAPAPATSGDMRLPPWAWVIGLIVVVIIILAIFV